VKRGDKGAIGSSKQKEGFRDRGARKNYAEDQEEKNRQRRSGDAHTRSKGGDLEIWRKFGVLGVRASSSRPEKNTQSQGVLTSTKKKAGNHPEHENRAPCGFRNLEEGSSGKVRDYREVGKDWLN